jgi:glucose/mannose transport system substrate-binding protein
MLSKKKMIASVAVASAALLAISQAPAANAAGASGKVEVFSWWTSGSESAALDAIFAGLKKANPDIEIVNAAVAGGAGTNARQVLATRLAAGDTPETWQSHPGGDLKGYVDQGSVQDLTSLYKSEGWSKVVPKALQDSMSYNGKTYSVLTGIHRANTLWYSKAAFRKAGASLPASATFADLSKAATKLKAAGIAPLCLGDKDIWTAAQLLEETIIGETNATTWNNLSAGKASWADAKVQTAISHFNTMLTWANSDHKALDWTGAVAALAKGTCGMNVMGDWAYGELQVKQGQKDGVDFGYSVIGDAKTFVTVGDSFVIGSKSKNKAGAEAFVKAVMDPKVQIAFNKLKGSAPYRTDVSTSSLGAYQRAAAKTLATGTLVASLVHGQQLVAASVSQAFSDGVTVLEANKDGKAFAKSMDAAAKAQA